MDERVTRLISFWCYFGPGVTTIRSTLATVEFRPCNLAGWCLRRRPIGMARMLRSCQRIYSKAIGSLTPTYLMNINNVTFQLPFVLRHRLCVRLITTIHLSHESCNKVNPFLGNIQGIIRIRIQPCVLFGVHLEIINYVQTAQSRLRSFFRLHILSTKPISRLVCCLLAILGQVKYLMGAKWNLNAKHYLSYTRSTITINNTNAFVKKSRDELPNLIVCGHHFVGDLYPVSPCSVVENLWNFVLIIRTNCDAPKWSCRLHTWIVNPFMDDNSDSWTYSNGNSKTLSETEHLDFVFRFYYKQ